MIKSKLLVGTIMATVLAIGTVAAVVKARPSSNDSFTVSSSGEVVVKEASTKPNKYGLPSDARMKEEWLNVSFGTYLNFDGPEYSAYMLKQQEVVKLLSFKRINKIEEHDTPNKECYVYSYEALLVALKTMDYTLGILGNTKEHTDEDEKTYMTGSYYLCKTKTGWEHSGFRIEN